MTVANFDWVAESASGRQMLAGEDRAGIHPDAGAHFCGKNRSRAANLPVFRCGRSNPERNGLFFPYSARNSNRFGRIRDSQSSIHHWRRKRAVLAGPAAEKLKTDGNLLPHTSPKKLPPEYGRRRRQKKDGPAVSTIGSNPFWLQGLRKIISGQIVSTGEESKCRSQTVKSSFSVRTGRSSCQNASLPL